MQVRSLSWLLLVHLLQKEHLFVIVDYLGEHGFTMGLHWELP